MTNTPQPQDPSSDGFWWKYVDAPIARVLMILVTPIRFALRVISAYIRKTRLYREIKGLVGEPIYGAAIAFTGFLAAVIASVHSSEIKKAFPFCCLPGLGGASPLTSIERVWVALFWIFACVWLYLYTLLEDVKSDSVSSLQKQSQELQSSVASVGTDVQTVQVVASKIREAVLTFPPDTFVSDFSTHVTNIRTRVLPVLEQKDDKKTLEETIRALLSAIVSLAYSYDTRRPRYAANVMVFVERQGNNKPHFPMLNEAAVSRFLPDAYDLGYLDGVLVLPKHLAVVVASSSEEAAEDHIEEELIFGIPPKFKKGDLWLVLPGAPRAFVRWNSLDAREGPKNFQRYADVFDDVSRLRDLIGKEFELHGTIDIDKYEAYYLHSAEGRNVRCFQSYPLLDVHTTPPKAFGILNVHCDRETFLGGESPKHAQLRQEIFAGVISPLIFDTAGIVHRWFEIAKNEYQMPDDNISQDQTGR